MPMNFTDLRAGDTSCVSARLTSSHLVGRHGELAELELAARDAAAARPGVILLGGDSGVGKTRLLAEFQESLAGNAIVLRGECLEQGEGELPYAPLLGALRPLVRRKDPVLQGMSDGGRAHLAALLPSLGVPTGERAGMIGDGAGQLQLFEALLELLETLSQKQPVVLIIEDVHWADRSTRTFLAFLASSLREERVLLVLSYRTDELHRRHPLRPLLADLDRIERARRITLEPFDRTELAEALTDILGQAPDDTLIERLLARSEGNPLYVEELLAAGLDGRGSPPQSLRDAFMLRIERLSPAARSVVRTVAVAGRINQELLDDVSVVAGVDLYEALREAVAEHVLEAGDDEKLRFRHALLREALYDDLLPGERGQLHLALAKALDKQPTSDCIEDEVERIGQVASHYAAAGDQPSALIATVHAAVEARRAHAYGDAASLAERALDLWPRVGNAEELVGHDEVTLLELAASSHGVSGYWPRSEQLLARAVELVDPNTQPLRYGRLLARLARSRWKLNRGREALELAEQALQVMPEGDGDADRAAVLSWLARTRVLRGQYREAIRDGEPALSAAQAVGEQWIYGEALNTLGMARIALGDVDRGEAELREAIDVAREIDDAEDLGTAYSNLADLLALRGRGREALEVVIEGLDEMPPRVRMRFAWMQLTRSVLAFEVGDWKQAQEFAGPHRESLAGVVLIFALLRDAELALAAGEHDQAETALAEVEPLVRVTSEAQWHGLYGSLLGELRRREGDLEAAQAAVAAALDELEVCTDDVMRIARVTAVGLSIETDRALRARDLRDEQMRKDALARADIHLSRLDAAAQDGGPVEQAWLLVGNAEIARARGESTSELWEQAATAFTALDRPPCVSIIRWRQAEALVEEGDREAAAQVAAGALTLALTVGAGWVTGELEALVARARLTVEPTAAAAAHDGATAGAPSTDENPFGLTARELQVLALVASGATNRQIGASLYMAEKTASVHVSRILAKLGVQTRTQAAAVAHRLHLNALAER